ncbi:ABC transporter ATP-binding protein [Roseateles sp. YR242]|uniref:ABC transporter ATP-binding protein n=1 Tax=Roseateles sp. YR242 TaxID=1855305 RepID=UPI000B84AC69|nr:ABC transporter ATP-binding protein [Roseateles sp. YR242]
MIVVDEAVAGYTPDVDILRGMSVRARQDEIVTLLGPNGCGKSTLLKTIAGYLTPRSGRVLLEGQDVSSLPVHRKIQQTGLGFVPQTENVFTSLSIRENLQVGGHHLPERAVRERMEELCQHYPVLKRKFKDPAASMSGGERQILALARALMPRPRMLLLDEPSAGLSPKMLAEVFEAVQQIRDHEGVCILMVEQNAMEALRISDRAYVLSMGRVALTGRAADLMDDPQVRELYLGGRAA